MGVEGLVLVETHMQRVNFIFEATPAVGQDPDALRAQASEILELGWFHPDELPETIPDTSAEFLGSYVEVPHARDLMLSSGTVSFCSASRA